ncbi:MAG TPA: glycoside hydrolase family 99-like domain-containing protein [Polyangia bacterium]|nr:glycoside hydrolase family 99-like domain-containing protein [Polyangia bacterium]
MGDVRFIAIYFPQLHTIPENDRWWGPGFTDWVNVKRARPLFPGHYQPRVPKDGYYDQSDRRVIRRQVEMAREYGISGFCHYHYWFEGKQLLETPTNLFLGMKDLDISFCLSWANETWSRRWDGQEHQILQLQTHTPSVAAWGRHFDYLIKAWTDPRALRIDGKPIFMIYRPDKLEQPGEMFDYWQSRAREHGLDGLYFVAVSQYKTPAWETLRHFDALFRFQPAVATVVLAEANPPFYKRHFAPLRAMVPRGLAIRLQSAIDRLHQPHQLDYDEVWQKIIEQPVDRALTTLEGAFVDWDNTARYGKRATIYRGAQPERFQHWLERLADKVRANNRPDTRLVFINAWNEWAESAYLEPDVDYGNRYLMAVRNVASRARDGVPRGGVLRAVDK